MYHHQRRQRQFYNRLWQLSITGLAVGAMAALGAVTILGLFGAL
ncbi:hypothetical protein [Sulfurivirga sp.]|nr:hypothetical protein [Sulfurivirga sp.]